MDNIRKIGLAPPFEPDELKSNWNQRRNCSCYVKIENRDDKISIAEQLAQENTPQEYSHLWGLKGILLNFLGGQGETWSRER